jgi:transcriptional regulator with XRE-family HTH domain
MTARRLLTKDETGDKERLKKVWEQKKLELNLSQQSVAKAFGITNQTAISQYLNGRIPLNLEAALKFSKVLQVRLSEISPRHATWVNDATNEALGERINEFLEGVATPLYISVEDDSQAPEIRSGDMICVNRSSNIDTDGIYVFNMDGRTVLRRVKSNPSKKSISLTANGIDELEIAIANAGMLHTAGRIVFVLHKV